MNTRNLQRTNRSLQTFNSAGQASAYGPSIAEIRNVEVQKNVPSEEAHRGESVPVADEKKEDDEEAA